MSDYDRISATVRAQLAADIADGKGDDEPAIGVDSIRLGPILGSVATMHGIEAPPERGDYPTRERYDRAYNEWWRRTHCWTTSIVDVDQAEDFPW